MSSFSATLQDALTPAYQLERELTGGGMSRVFVAQDVNLGRHVVVKVLPPELAAGVNHERFRREIQVAAQLQHPHIVPLLSAGEKGALIWYTMPFIKGQSLREALAAGTRYAVRDVIRILRDVAEALDYAHGLGVIHRDIKPGNVLLMGSHALVTDFGVAKAISAAMPSSGFTSAGMAIGTPAYMAPEQLAADPTADHRMDLYALGLVAYEMLTGAVPFKEDSPQKTMAAQLTRDPAPIETTRADVPPAFSALIKRLLAKLPDERPQNAADVVAALDALVDSSGPSAALPLTAGRQRMRALAGVGLSLAVIATAWAIGRSEGDSSRVNAAPPPVTDSTSRAFAPAATLLTRDDSLAIARAVQERVAKEKPPVAPTSTSSSNSVASAEESARQSAMLAAFTDSIRQLVQRSVIDSIVRLETRRAPGTRVFVGDPTAALVEGARGGPLPPPPPSAGRPRETGPRRVVIAEPRPTANRPELAAIARGVADSIRAALSMQRRFVVVPADSVAAVLLRTRTINAVQEALSADLFISISLVPARDSVVRMVQVRDLAAYGPYSFRAATISGSASDPAAGAAMLAGAAVKHLIDMDRAPRAASRPEGRPEMRSAPRPERTPDPRE